MSFTGYMILRTNREGTKAIYCRTLEQAVQCYHQACDNPFIDVAFTQLLHGRPKFESDRPMSPPSGTYEKL